MADKLIEEINPLLERRKEYEKRTDEIQDIILAGNQKANEVAAQTMSEVRAAIKLD